MTRIAHRFSHMESRRAANAYLRGLLSDVERKNCWNLAEHAGLSGPQAMQCLLRSARWPTVRDDVRGYVSEHLGGDGVLIADETGCAPRGAEGSCGRRSPPPVIAVTGCSWRQAEPRVGGEAGSSLDNVGTDRNHQTVRARKRRWKGCKEAEPVVDAP
nr:transposase [Microbispora catharanthi]